MAATSANVARFWSIVAGMVTLAEQFKSASAAACPDVSSIPYGDVFSSRESPYPPGTILTFSCDPGFKGQGPQTITCMQNGLWSDRPPYCTANECERDINNIENGRKCRKQCKDDNDCSGALKKCLCDGWCGKSCYNPGAQCSRLNAPANGIVEFDHISYGYEATYRCDDGYILIGHASRSCRSDKKWSRCEPKCIVPATFACKLESVPENFNVFLDSGEKVETVPFNFGLGTRLQFRCIEEDSESTNVSCAHGGWQPPIPTRCDYSLCGQAGDVGSVRKLLRRRRSIGGDDAVERAWPWQALITKYDQRLLYAYENVMGGGSLINDRWVLSAAHVFTPHKTGLGWETAFMVSLGILRRPNRINMLEGSVKIFQPEKIFTHEEYNIYEGQPAIGTSQNDVALIKLGGLFSVTLNGQFLSLPEVFPGMVDFTPYIRPVCLPCSLDSCVTKVLMKEDSKGQVLIKGDETPEEKCKIEYEFLMGKNDKDLVAVVTTGFGHNASRKDNDASWIVATQVMQQAVLDIEDRQQCKKAVAVISGLKAIPGFEHIFTDEMFCAVGSSATKRGQTIVDTCKGDGGGPVVRQVRDETTKKECFVQLGIVSWGYGCGQVTFVEGKRFLFPGFYTDVTSMMSWINRTMEDYEKSKNAPKP